MSETKFTPSFIREQRLIEAKSTPKPWAKLRALTISDALFERSVATCGGYSRGYPEQEAAYDENAANTEYIVTAANNYPDALAEIERWRDKFDCKRLAYEHLLNLAENFMKAAENYAIYIDEHSDFCQPSDFADALGELNEWLKDNADSPVSYPEKPEALRRQGPEWGELGDLADEHNIIIEGEEEPEV